MNTNIKLIQAIQSLTDVGLDMAKAADCISELEQSVSYWKNSAREFERRLEAAEASLTTVRARNDGLAQEIIVLNKDNKDLRRRIAEAIQVKEKVLAELSADHTAFDEERLGLTARIAELETKLGEALTANWTEAVIPKLPEVMTVEKANE